MTQPNIILIVTDDQPRGLLDVMPFIRTNIREAGVNLLNGYATTPLCGPSRSSLLTGLLASQHGVWSNDSAWDVFSPLEGDTIATRLHDAGYHTSLAGKYMNAWSGHSSLVPPGWDDFLAIVPDDGGDGAYYNYILRGTGPDTHYGTAINDYSTDVVSAKAVQFIADAPADKPLFLYYAPYGAHAPFQAAPRYEGTESLPTVLNPAVNENMYDKSAWLRGLPLLDENEVKSKIRNQREVVKAVDDGVRDIFNMLATYNRTNNLFVYLGDNGLQHGQHRLNGKNVPYEGSTHLQMMLRWDGHFAPGDNTDMIRVIDLATTMSVAGEVPLLGSGTPYQAASPPAGIVLAGAPDRGQPAWVSWRNKNWNFIQYSTREVELYDLVNDPNELTNCAPQNPDKVVTYRQRCQNLGGGTPPGFSW